MAALEYAKCIAQKHRQINVDTRCLFLAILNDYNSVPTRLLRLRGIEQHDAQKLLAIDSANDFMPTMETSADIQFSNEANGVLAEATQIAQKRKCPASTSDIFQALLRRQEAREFSERLGLDVHELLILSK